MIASEGENPSKKLKLASIFNPFVSTGPVAASRSSAVEDTEYLTLESVETDTLFFPDAGRGDLDAISIGRSVENALKRPHAPEEILRNAVYTELKVHHGIQFPASSEHSTVERKLRSHIQWDHRYKETDLAHLLQEFHRHREGARLLHGLNVTTTSLLPDMTVLREKYLYFGEFKNSQKYTNENAAKQCTLYLYSLLYFFRVRLGLDVKAVFGFWVCGPGCFPRRNQYSVGYIRLAAPEQLGGSLVPQVLSKFYAIDSVAGIQQLICFLKVGKIIELDVDEPEAALHVGRRIPALLSLPRMLWDSELLVLNGTASMVFKGTGDEILGLLAQIHRRPIPYLGTFLSSAETSLKGNDSIFYLKIRLKDTTLRENPGSTAAAIFTKYKDLFKEMYKPIEMFPVEPVEDADCGLFLMNDCGVGLRQSKEFRKLSFPAFRACFATLWKDISTVKDVFLHGDALPHNMVYNVGPQKIMLIDIDEGTVGVKAHKRVVEEADQLLYAYLRYPNFFRAWRNRQLYTDLQLAASFLLLAEMFEQTLDEQNKESMRSLQKAAEAANSFLKRVNNDDPTAAYGSAVDQSVYQLVELLEKTLEAGP